MARSEGSDADPEEDMLPDERAVIAERASDLADLDESELLSTEELKSELGLESDE